MRSSLLALIALFPASVAAAPPSGQTPTPILDLDLTSDATLVIGAEARLEMTVMLATALLERAPQAGAEVTVALAPGEAGDVARDLWRGRTAATGHVTPRFVVPGDLKPGAVTLRISATAGGATATVDRHVQVVDDSALQLRVDRTLYRPGSVIRWRVAWLRTANAHPVPGATLAVDIVDPRGTHVWSGRVTTDARGLASGELPLAEDLITGDYELRARGGHLRDTLKIEVRPFEPPPFLLDVEHDAAALVDARRLTGTVYAHTAYGEGVVGTLRVELRTPQGAVRPLVLGETLGEARSFDLDVGDLREGTALIHARAVDGADRVVEATREVTIGRPHLDVALVVPGDSLVGGRPQPVHVVTTDASGAPVPARLVVTVEDTSGEVLRTTRRSSPGAAEVAVSPPRSQPRAKDEVIGQVTHWHLGHSRAFSPDDTLDERLPRSLEHAAGGVARCLDSDSVELELSFGRAGWRLDAARVRPFPERPDFVMDAPAEVTTCVSNRLLARLPTPPRRSVKARARLEASIVRTIRRVEWESAPREVVVRVTATAADGREGETSTRVPVGSERDGDRVVHVDRAVVPPGAPIRVRAPWPSTDATVYATLLRHGAPIATARCRREGTEVVAELTAPAGTYGLAAVRLHSASWSPGARNIERSEGAANVFLAPNTLDVSVAAPTRVGPGARAVLDVTVRDALGRVAAGAGLVAAVVDERVLALSTPQGELSAVLLKGDLDALAARATVFGRLLRRAERTPVEVAAMRALVASVPLSVPEPEVLLPARDRYLAERARAAEIVVAARDQLVKTPGAVVTRHADGTLTMASSLAETLTAAGWKRAALTSPFGVDRTWADVTALQPSWTVDAWAREVASDRLDALETALGRYSERVERLAKRGPFDPARLIRTAHLATDAWGGRFEVRRESDDGWISLRAAGPDGALGTEDDLVRYDIFGEGGIGGMGYYGVGAGGGGLGARGFAMGSVRSAVGGRGRVVAAVAPLRERFDETALWVVGETTDADGRARFPFTLPDSVTGWDVRVEAVAADGAVGVGAGHIETYLPLFVEVRAPRRLTVGDSHEIAAYVTNHEASGSVRIALAAEGGLRIAGEAAAVLDVPRGETRVARFTAMAERAGPARIVTRLSDSRGERDAIARDVEVAGRGIARRVIVPGELSEGAQRITLSVPEDADRDTVRGRLRVFRGAADQALDGLEGLLREPHGCFEQTTSTTYPNLLVLHLLEGSRGADAGIVANARELVGKGYQRLLKYEVEGGGFSWFGTKPANLTLTALGVMEFSDMAAVYPVDKRVIARTRRWIETRQERDGSYPAETHWAPDDGALATTAFVTWSLAETGDVSDSVLRGLRFLRKHRRDLAERPYALALWAAAEARAGGDPATPLALLDGIRKEDGDGATYPSGLSTLFMESGRVGQVDTTALVATARLLAGTGRHPEGELRWLWSARDARYGWGTTQATVQALRAATIAQRGATGPLTGRVDVRLDGGLIGTLDLDAPEVPSLTLPSGLSPGEHTLTLSGPEELRMFTDLRMSWQGTTPAVPTAEGLVVHLTAGASRVAAGGQVEMTVGVANPSTEAVKMPTLTIPVPPGFVADRESLERLVRETAVTRFDETGDRVNLYLTELGPGGGEVLRYRLEATTPCDVTQRPAEAYAYYSPDVRGTSGPLRLKVWRRAPTTASLAP